MEKEKIQELREKIRNFIDLRNYKSAKETANFLLKENPGDEMAIFFLNFIDITIDDTTDRTTIQPFPDIVSDTLEKLIESKDLDEEKSERYILYLNYIDKVLQNIGHRVITFEDPLTIYVEEIMPFVEDIYLQCLERPLFYIRPDDKLYLLKELNTNFYAAVLSFVSNFVEEEHEVLKKLKLCYSFGNIERAYKRCGSEKKEPLPYILQEKSIERIQLLNEMFKPMKEQFDELIQKKSFFGPGKDVLDLARKMFDNCSEQRKCAEIYMSSFKKTPHEIIEKIKVRQPVLYHNYAEELNSDLLKKGNEFSKEYNVNNYFYHYYNVNFNKVKYTNKKDYKEYNPNGFSTYEG